MAKAEGAPQSQGLELDLGIRCDYLLSMKGGDTAVARDAFVGIRGSRIEVVEPWRDGAWRPKRLIHARDQVVMPGLINGHTHLPMVLFRGLADDQPFHDWIFKYIIPLEAKFVREDFVRVGTELGALESLRSGVTTVCDMYYHEDVIADVLDRMGARAVVAEAIADFPIPDDPARDGNNWRIIDRMRERYRGHERITAALGPHAPYSCSDETLARVREYAARHAMPVLIHVAETRKEYDDSIAQHGMSPVKRLAERGILDLKPICAHCVHLNDEDIGLMARSGAAAIYNPESNMKLGCGVARVPEMLKAGVRVGIGTDGAASNNDLCLFRDLDAGAKLQKLAHEDNTAMTAAQALRLATCDGARALGLGDRIGSLEPGKLADVIAVDLRYPHLQPVHDVVSQLVYAATGLEVSTVICHGRILMENSEMPGVDPGRIYAEAAAYAEKIRQSSGS